MIAEKEVRSRTGIVLLRARKTDYNVAIRQAVQKDKLPIRFPLLSRSHQLVSR